MKQKINPNFIPNTQQKSWSEKTVQCLQELTEQLASTNNGHERVELTQALQTQWDYLEKIGRAVEQRRIYQALPPAEQEAKWTELRTKLTTREGEQDQVGYDLFALLDRSQVQERVVANLGKLGTILKTESWGNLKSYSEGGWYDCVIWCLEGLAARETSNLRELITEELTRALLTSLLYEIKELASTTAQALGLDIDF